jgi:hypothetical protein
VSRPSDETDVYSDQTVRMSRAAVRLGISQQWLHKVQNMKLWKIFTASGAEVRNLETSLDCNGPDIPEQRKRGTESQTGNS